MGSILWESVETKACRWKLRRHEECCPHCVWGSSYCRCICVWYGAKPWTLNPNPRPPVWVCCFKRQHVAHYVVDMCNGIESHHPYWAPGFSVVITAHVEEVVLHSTVLFRATTLSLCWLLAFAFETGNVFTWGRDEGEGRLGYIPGPVYEDGTCVPEQVRGIPDSIAAVACGGFFSMALTSAGQLWSWGGKISS